MRRPANAPGVSGPSPRPASPAIKRGRRTGNLRIAWKTGGGSTWVTGSYDPESNLVYWGIGNPGPDWNADSRPGDNLYTCSLVALDGDTGALKWHFQFTPHDTHDWDSTHVPVLFEGEVRGVKRKLVAVANRNAFFYVLDRSSGEFIAGRAYAKQTWAKGLDDRGRPMVIPNTEPSAEGTIAWPNLNGATVWFSPSYSPKTGLFYVSVREIGSIYYKREADYKPGTFFAGGGEAGIPNGEKSGAIRALEVATGKMRWEFPLHSASWSGVLSTGGGLVFSGSDEGNFFALDATNRQAPVGFSNRRSDRVQSNLLHSGRKAMRGDRRRSGPLHLQSLKIRVYIFFPLRALRLCVKCVFLLFEYSEVRRSPPPRLLRQLFSWPGNVVLRWS